MDSLTARVSVVIVMLGCLECSYVYFDRRCPAWQISHGIRKETWEKETILYCFQFDTNDTNSRHIYLNNGLTSLNCETAGKDYFLQALIEFSTKLYEINHILSAAYCAEKKDYKLVNCSMPMRKFSYMKGFDIMYYSRVLRKIVSAPSEFDNTTFQIELCDLERL